MRAVSAASSLLKRRKVAPVALSAPGVASAAGGRRRRGALGDASRVAKSGKLKRKLKLRFAQRTFWNALLAAIVGSPGASPRTPTVAERLAAVDVDSPAGTTVAALIEALGLSPLKVSGGAPGDAPAGGPAVAPPAQGSLELSVARASSRGAAALGGAAAGGSTSLLKRRRGGAPARNVATQAEAGGHAAGLLMSFGDVRSPAGLEGELRPKDVGAGGWCFFAAFQDQLGSAAVPSFHYVAVLALAALADRQEEFAATVQGVDFLGDEVPEIRAARAALRGVPAYRALGVVELLTPFQCVVLDKFEGVLADDLLDSRRYADYREIQVLLQLFGLQVLVVESNDALLSEEAARSCVYPTLERAGSSVRARLEGGELDMVFVRYEQLQYQHFTSVAFDGERPWHVNAEKRRLVEVRFAECAVCRAVRAGDDDLARTLLLSKLGCGSAASLVL